MGEGEDIVEIKREEGSERRRENETKKCNKNEKNEKK